MGTITLTKGLPGSGKSYWAKEQVRNSITTYRINRDDLRAMMYDMVFSGKREGVVTDVQVAAAKAVLADKQARVIIDDTNLNSKTVKVWETLAKSHQHKFEIVEFNTPIEECIRRDSLREGKARVGRAVIEGMALKNGMIDFSDHDKWLLLDMDGTAACITHRLHYVKNGNKDWNSFFRHCNLDTVREDVVAQVNDYVKAGVGVIVLSGRPTDKCGVATEEWITANNIPCNHLFMRNAGDSRGDELMKEDVLKLILQNIKVSDIVVAFDDRPKIVRLWKSYNIPVIDCGDGIEF